MFQRCVLRIAFVLPVLLVGTLVAQKLDVKIIDRQDSERTYTYVVPGFFSSNSNTNLNCNGTDTTVTCHVNTATSGFNTPASQVSYSVRGATFTLLLPDGRGVIVNCESKFSERFAGRSGNKRDCRKPYVENIQAEFNGDKAKLSWNVSLDGKKAASETYKILAILEKPNKSKDEAPPDKPGSAEKKDGQTTGK